MRFTPTLFSKRIHSPTRAPPYLVLSTLQYLLRDNNPDAETNILTPTTYSIIVCPNIGAETLDVRSRSHQIPPNPPNPPNAEDAKSDDVIRRDKAVKHLQDRRGRNFGTSLCK